MGSLWLFFGVMLYLGCAYLVLHFFKLTYSSAGRFSSLNMGLFGYVVALIPGINLIAASLLLFETPLKYESEMYISILLKRK